MYAATGQPQTKTESTMLFTYQTSRLILSVLNEDHADSVKQFYEENYPFFAPYEPAYPENFFTTEYQKFLLGAQLKQFLHSEALRYYMYEKTNAKRIIGCVAFSNIRLGNERSCSISYKLAGTMQQKGYALEAARFLLQLVSIEFSMHRVEADILPYNLRSIHLAERLGFSFEGIAKSSHLIQGVWKDHARYALILE